MERLLTIKHFVHLHHRSGFGVTYLPRFFSLSNDPRQQSFTVTLEELDDKLDMLTSEYQINKAELDAELALIEA